MELATKRILIQTHSSHASGSGTDEGTGDKPGVPYVPTYASEWMSKSLGNHKGPNVDNEQTDSDNDGDDFVPPKFSTHDKEDSEEEGSDLRVQTPSHYESTNDEESDEVTHGANIKGEELDEEVTKEEDEANEFIQGQQQSSSVSSGFVSNMFNPSPDTGIDSIFNLNAESTSLVDVPVTTIAEPPLSSTTTLPPPTIPLITHLQQTPAPTLTTVLNEAQAENEDFINKLDDNIKKIIKDQVKEDVKEQVSKILPKIEKTVNEQLEAEVLSHSSNESKTSHAIAANLFEFELKKILIDNMEIMGDTVSFKRRQDDENKDEEPSVGSDRGSKRRRARKEPESDE
ncbi:hypothetical protein Tco_1142362 [Tanacetum coccineum]